MYLILKVIVKINKDLVRSCNKLFHLKILERRFTLVFSLNETYKYSIYAKHIFISILLYIFFSVRIFFAIIILRTLRSPISPPNKFFAYFKNILFKLIFKLFNKKFLLTYIAVFIVGASLRHFIEFFFNLDVLKTPLDIISILYFLIMAILVPLLTVVINKLLLNGSINLITIIKLLFISKTFWFSIVNIFIISYTIKVNITY